MVCESEQKARAREPTTTHPTTMAPALRGHSPVPRGEGGKARSRAAWSASYPVDTKEYRVRVLRYPDGYERVLRYPKYDKKTSKSRLSSAQTVAETTPATASESAWDIVGVWKAETDEKTVVAETPAPPAARPEEEEGVSAPGADASTTDAPTAPSSIPDTPTELLRKMNSPSFLLSSKLEWDYAKSSFEVLHACPWVEPRPLFVLAAPETSATFTLRTRVRRDQEEDDLNRLLGGSKKRLEVSHLTDGVVSFESHDRASDFASAQTSEDLLVFEVDSHDLFKMAEKAKAVVVLMKRANVTPRMLAAVLRDQRAPDE